MDGVVGQIILAPAVPSTKPKTQMDDCQRHWYLVMFAALCSIETTFGWCNLAVWYLLPFVGQLLARYVTNFSFTFAYQTSFSSNFP